MTGILHATAYTPHKYAYAANGIGARGPRLHAPETRDSCDPLGQTQHSFHVSTLKGNRGRLLLPLVNVRYKIPD